MGEVDYLLLEVLDLLAEGLLLGVEVDQLLLELVFDSGLRLVHETVDLGVELIYFFFMLSIYFLNLYFLLCLNLVNLCLELLNGLFVIIN